MHGNERDMYIALAILKLLLTHHPEYVIGKIPDGDSVDMADIASKKTYEFVVKLTALLERDGLFSGLSDFHRLAQVLSSRD